MIFRRVGIIFFWILLAAIVGLLLYVVIELRQPLSKSAAQMRQFKVMPGESKVTIGNNLQSQQFIRSGWLFALYAKVKRANLQSGVYDLSSSQTIGDIIAKMAKGDVLERSIVIKEGMRREEIGAILEKYRLAQKDEFLAKTEDKEGYLFPDTYFIPVNTSLDKIIKLFEDNFAKKTADVFTPCNMLHGTCNKEDVIILASIVEREAKLDGDRAPIARVYLNRLNKGMKLEADPTIQYAKGNWEKISNGDKKIDSFYNTYLYKGLPPGPICNPGLKSIEASINPPANDYLYFFHLKDGTTIFSQTKEEHEANLEKYRSQM
jgi:UPF0755 protein